MRITVRLLGLDLLDVDLSTDSTSPEPDDAACHLSGGTLATSWIEAGSPDRYMGFTNGRGDE